MRIKALILLYKLKKFFKLKLMRNIRIYIIMKMNKFIVKMIIKKVSGHHVNYPLLKNYKFKYNNNNN